MPEMHLYENNQQVNIDVTVVNASDRGMPVISIGGQHFAVDRMALDSADTNRDRKPTQEEKDRAEGTKQVASSRKKASKKVSKGRVEAP